MKRHISLARILMALFVAGGVAAVHFGLWAVMNRPVSVVEPLDYIDGFSYSPYRRDQTPLRGIYPSYEEIAQDLVQLGGIAHRIRTYNSTENPEVSDLAGRNDLKVTAGAWIDSDKLRNRREIGALLADARLHSNIDRLMVGNEALLRADVTMPEMIEYLSEVREATDLPVSTAEPWHVWLKNPELANHVDYLAVHLLPYHEGLPADKAVDYAMARYQELLDAFPGKPILIGEIGWPSKGPTIQAAVASEENQARFVREFLYRSLCKNLDYFLIEAYDQPWKIEIEGWAGAYWGMFNADRQLKFPLEGSVDRNSGWIDDAVVATVFALVPMLLLCLAQRGMSMFGLLWMCVLVQACVTAIVISARLPADYYFTLRDLTALIGLVFGVMLTAGVLLTNGFEFAEVFFKARWRRAYKAAEPLPPERQPFVSVHLACCNEPPEMVIATIDSLAAMDYQNFEVLVIDNNTKDEALWKPVEARMAELGPRFRFFHLSPWPGFKAGALNFGLKQTDPRATVVGVVDADYVVTPDWLSALIPHFHDEKVAVVQAPQAHREWERHPFRRMCNWEFEGFFRIGMHHRHERNALIQHGTMTLVRRSRLESSGNWSEWCICEDTELGLRLLENGDELRYIDRVFGRGLTPASFAALKSQRFRWAFGAMQILKGHWRSLFGRSKLDSGQRYHFITGWFSWFGDALQLVFAMGAIAWTAAMLIWPKLFSLPVTIMLAPVLGLLVAKAAMGPILYRRAMDCPWADIAGASLVSLGLSHSIARGVMAGLTHKRGVFLRTAKGRGESGLAQFFQPIREETYLLLALIAAAWAMIMLRGTQNIEVVLWVTMLGLQSLPYLAAVGCQFIAQLPEKAEPLPAQAQAA
ncbi:MAG: glycosyltransferase [Methyloversatilis sp.]|uniref:glycosyltransferase n=1 Tax=Methyloversatilis sp. TaxID=2569862 RepID=UPI00273366EA|nr:glycosyltransferase [Methyloversatilis sp.]MDP3874162.1 glycosyltransferase [Methyloversatilis sp.]